MAEIKRTFFIWNMLSLAFYTTFSLLVILTMWGSSIYFWAVISIATVYITSFGLVILFSRNDKKKLKGNVKDYKSGIKILHSLLRIAAFMLNITAVVGIFGAKKNITVQVFSTLC